MSIAISKKVKFDGARCPFSTFLRLQGDHHCACAQKWCHFSFFSKSFQTKKKIKALRPKMTKIASRGGGPALIHGGLLLWVFFSFEKLLIFEVAFLDRKQSSFCWTVLHKKKTLFSDPTCALHCYLLWKTTVFLFIWSWQDIPMVRKEHFDCMLTLSFVLPLWKNRTKKKPVQMPMGLCTEKEFLGKYV